jgi:hypothetical protein
VKLVALTGLHFWAGYDTNSLFEFAFVWLAVAQDGVSLVHIGGQSAAMMGKSRFFPLTFVMAATKIQRHAPTSLDLPDRL